MRNETFADANNRTHHTEFPRTTEHGQSSRPTPPSVRDITSGLLVGTVIATEIGWCAVEDLVCGVKVLTAHNGLQPVTHIQRATMYFGSSRNAPIHIPANALDNRGPVTVLPAQKIVVAKHLAPQNAPCTPALITANNLLGLWGISQQQDASIVEIVTIGFREDQIVQTSGLVLLHCPAAPIIGTPDVPVHPNAIVQSGYALRERARVSVKQAALAFARLRTQRILSMTTCAGSAMGTATARNPTRH